MKNSRFKLYNWSTNDGTEIIDVDWPKVQKTVGTDHIEWILKQDREKCQMVVDKLDQDYALMVEFYDDTLLTAYHLMWAK